MSATEWKFVPVKPNEKQAYQAAFNLCNEFGEVFVRENERFAMAVYDALLAAAPVPPSVESLLENWTPSDQQAFAKFRDEHFPCEMSSYAIQSLGSAWKDGQANASTEVPQYTGTGSDSLDCILGVGGFASFGPLDAQPAAHLTIPGALEWDGDNGTHGADGESGAHGESEVDRLKERAKWLGEMAASNGREYEKQLVIAHDLRALSVTNILMAVVPGDGSGHEVYAKSVDEVVNALSFMGDKAEALEGEAVNLRAQLTNTEQSRRSFFDLSQDLEKRLAERDALLLEASTWIKQNSFGGSDAVDLWERLDAIAGPAKCERCGDWGHIETEDSAHDCPECGPSVIERAVEAGVMNAPKQYAADDIPDFTPGSGNKAKRRIAAIEKAKPKTCTACDGWGAISTGIDEAPSTNCKKCDGTGKGGDQ